MPTALVTITKKHKYSMGTPDAAGNKMITVTGQITMDTFTQSTTTDGMELDLSADIPNIEGVFIQGDAGYVVQYDYSNKKIEVYVQGTATEASSALTATTNDDLLDAKVFIFEARGF